MNDRIGVSKYACRYPNCSSKYYKPIFKKDYYNKRFYRFPRNGTVSVQWKDICKIDHSVVTDNFFVCEDHFVLEDFMNFTKNRLKPGMIPTKPSRSFSSTDHDYTENDVNDRSVDFETDTIVSVAETTTNSPDKYAFLLDRNEELCPNSDSGTTDSKPTKLTMLNIHQVVTSNLIKLRNILHNEKHLLKKLFWLYKNGKFDYIRQQLSHISNEFLESQLEHTMPLSTTKWTKEDRLLALSFYNRNEKLYKYLCTFFYFPPAGMLLHIMSNIPFKTGINRPLMSQMKSDVDKMNIGNQTCALLMGEMMLTCGVRYDESSQELLGYEDLDHLGRSAKAADRVLVLAARGLRKNWIQVVSYYFASGPFKDVHLQNIIVKTIKQLQFIGLNVVTFVCEQNNINLNALSLLCARTERRSNSSYFIVNCNRICIVFDVRHLLKETRNALMKCEILYNGEMGKVARLKYIESAYNIDQSKRVFKLLSKLNDQYFDAKDSSVKTNLAAATATISHAVAVSIETFVIWGELPQEAMDTAEFVETMDTLFDSLSGFEEEPPDGKKYRCALSSDSPHLKFWSHLLGQFEKWKVIHLESGEDSTSRHPFIKGWQTTVESIFYLWNHLKDQGYFPYLSLRRFNLEPIERLLEGIAQYGDQNQNLTAYQFVAALKSEVLLGVEDPYTDDNSYNLTSLLPFVEDLFNGDSGSWESTRETHFDDLNCNIFYTLGFHEEAACLSGYLLQKMDIPNCELCRSHLLAEWVVNNTEILSLKECGDDSTYPLFASDSVVRIVDKILYQLYRFLRGQSSQERLEDRFKILYKHEYESFRFCSIHSCNEDFFDLCIKLGIYRFVTKFNKGINKNK